MNHRLLIIGAGMAQVPGIIAANEFGYETIVVDGSPKAPGLEFGDASFVIDIRNIDAIYSLAKEYGVFAVTSFSSEIALKTVGALNDLLGTPGLSATQVLNTTDKGIMRSLHKKAKLPIPQFNVVSNHDELDAAVKIIGFPCVIKPTDSSGSKGVSYVASLISLHAAFQYAQSESSCGEVLCEAFLPGTEYAIEAFVFEPDDVRVLMISEKKRTKPPNLLDTQVLFPANLNDQIKSELKILCQRSVKALDLAWCPVHMEVILTDSGPMIVELAGRGAGFKVFSTILPLMTGIDTLKTQISMLEKKGEFAYLLGPDKVQAACLKFMSSPEDGIFISAPGESESRCMNGVLEFDIYPAKDSHVHKLKSGADRLGHVIALSNTAEQAARIANNSIASAKINIHSGVDVDE